MFWILTILTILTITVPKTGDISGTFTSVLTSLDSNTSGTLVYDSVSDGQLVCDLFNIVVFLPVLFLYEVQNFTLIVHGFHGPFLFSWCMLYNMHVEYLSRS